jgi:hypothetical protein
MNGRRNRPARRDGASRLLGVFGAASTVALGLMASACGTRADDINWVQPGYVSKALFQTDDEWYIRRTIVKSETTNEYAIEGHGDLWIDRVKFRIEEGALIAYRPYEAIPGSQITDPSTEAERFEGSVLAAWPIVSHFDIIRGYDSLTGRETNVIQENTTDRPWTERQYMRVNFSNNLVEASFTAGAGVFDYPLNIISTGARWAHCDEEPTNPYCSRFSEDSIDLVQQVYLGMDLINCAAYVGYSYDGYGNCGFGEAKVRHNFTRIRNKSDFVPRDYPDSVVRKGADGKPIYDDDTGEVLREPIYDRFGVFRLEVPTYDRGYGNTESGRLWRAMIFNLWERHTDDSGAVLPYSARTPKPIIYYLNVEYPDRWRQAAREVAADYNRVFTSMVSDLTGKPADQLPAMFEIRDNDCNAGNIRSFVSTNPDLRFAVERVVCANGESCEDPLAKVGLGNLTRVCTSLENASRDPMTGKTAFDWQRIGDSRYSMVVWFSNPQQSGWGGLGPMHADARTGETITGTAYLRGMYYEASSATIVDYIEFINDEKSPEDIIYGQDIRKHISATLARQNQMTSSRAGSQFLTKMGARMDSLGDTIDAKLPEIDPNFQRNRMKRVEGTRVESDYLTDPLRISAATNGKWRPDSGAPIPDAGRFAATPNGWMDVMNPMSAVHDRTRRALTAAGFCFLQADFDPHWAGLALQLRDMNREDRYQFVGNMMIKHVMLHELGHNLSLSHNFEGSYDALNYFDTFWDAHWGSDLEKLQARYDEKRNTTVMEYMSGKGAFTDKLGKYDEAAIRFAYGEQVQVFNKADVTGGMTMRDWRYMSDYNKIPDYVCAGSAGGLGTGTACASPDEARRVLRERSWVTFDPQNPPANEVPYLFCDNYYDRRTPFCATFDYGSSQREIFANYYSTWSNYFFFNNFIRDRLTPLSWSANRAMMPVIYAMLHWSTVGQYYYFLRAFDAEGFSGTDLEADMLTTIGHGLNMAAEVMSTPEPIRMCPWPGTPVGTPGDADYVPQIYIPYYFLPDCDEYAAINSPYAIEREQIHPPLGAARPSALGFTDDFVEYDLAFVGSYFDKYNMMWLLGMVRNNLFMRFDFEGLRGAARHDRYNYSLFRILEPEIRDFYDKLIRLDPFLIDQSTATDLGSFWCRDPENPNAASMGYFEARSMIDPTTGEATGRPSSSCESGAIIYPTLLRNMPFDAMYFAHALFSSEFDTALDMGKSMKVYVVGSDDEFPEWRNLPADEVCSCVDALTGLDYRAVRQPAGVPDIGCRLIERACDSQNDYFQDEASDYYHDRWRAWFERLEFARDLGRIFDR